MFTSDRDQLPPRQLFTWRQAFLALVASGIVTIVLIGIRTNVFTRAGFLDLPVEEQDALQRMTERGFEMVDRRIDGFSGRSYFIPDINWKPSTMSFAVTGITIVGRDFTAIRPEINYRRPT